MIRRAEGRALAARRARIAAILIVARGAHYLVVGFLCLFTAPNWNEFNPGDPFLALFQPRRS
jgi:hypothetical protein